MKYEIIGDIMPAVEITLENTNEAMICQSGAMSWMDPNIEMSTNMKGGLLKGISRAFAGESMFIVTYTAKKGNIKIGFSSSFPGEIKAIDVQQHQGMIVQKGSFLCAQDSVNPNVVFNKKLMSGMFAGEGFVLQELLGEGICFLEIDGNCIIKELEAGETILVDTGNVVAFDRSVSYEVESISGGVNVLFGGEGLFVTRLTGPGTVLVQTQNYGDFARRLIPYIPTRSN